jgi:hypothetical protein
MALPRRADPGAAAQAVGRALDRPAPPRPAARSWRSEACPRALAPTAFQALVAARATGPLGRRPGRARPAADLRVRSRRRLRAHRSRAPRGRAHRAQRERRPDDAGGLILGAWRDVGAEHQPLPPGAGGPPYVPPPPYQKLDPRSVPPTQLRDALPGRPLAKAHQRSTASARRLTAAWAAAAGVEPRAVLEGEALDAAARRSRALAADRRAVARRVDLAVARRAERRASWRRARAAALEGQAALVERRLTTPTRPRRGRPRRRGCGPHADLLLAHAHGRCPAAPSARSCVGFDGRAGRRSALDPKLSAAANAERWYEQARRREARAARAAARRPALEAEAAAIAERLARLDGLDDASWPPGPRSSIRPLACGRPPPRGPRRRSARLRGRRRVATPARTTRSPSGSPARSTSGSMPRASRAPTSSSAAAAARCRPTRFASPPNWRPVTPRWRGRGRRSSTTPCASTSGRSRGCRPAAVHYAHQRTLAVVPRRLSQVAEDADRCPPRRTASGAAPSPRRR